jgi:hypothetical protein
MNDACFEQDNPNIRSQISNNEENTARTDLYPFFQIIVSFD